jgi:hypothetical protein
MIFKVWLRSLALAAIYFNGPATQNLTGPGWPVLAGCDRRLSRPLSWAAAGGAVPTVTGSGGLALVIP